VRAVDQGTIEGAVDQQTIERARNDASDGCCERCIMERRIVQSMDGASNGS